VLSFDRDMEDMQVRWRERNIEVQAHSFQNGLSRPWILPASRWEDGLWPPLRSGDRWPVVDYLRAHDVSRHTGSHNLKSSWVSGANLYFPFGQSEGGRRLLATYLASRVDERVRSVDSIELEYAETGDLSPSRLLGEEGGSRGSGQTSPDIAFLINAGAGLLLVENKLTEHSFYPCSARKTTGSVAKPGNPDAGRCTLTAALAQDAVPLCHQQAWGRKYWETLQGVVDRQRISDLPWCPAAKAGYQLFRQQALAEGLAESGNYEFVVSAVALDERNKTLTGSLKSSGLGDVRDWSGLFCGRASFRVFTHQDWAAWVRANDAQGAWGDWAAWVAARYEI